MIINNIRLNTDTHRTSFLAVLDLSARFDTVDHNMLDRLSGIVQVIEGRGYYVRIGEHKDTHDMWSPSRLNYCTTSQPVYAPQWAK